MSDPTKAVETTEKKTAAERKAEERAALPEAVRTQLYLKDQQRAVQAQIAEKSWGAQLDVATRHAVADYCVRFGLDPVEDIDVLGGRPYRKANYYIRRLAVLSQAGAVEWHKAEHVEIDERLVGMSKDLKDPENAGWAQKELNRRLRLRIEHAIPDAAKGAVVFTVKLKNQAEPIAAANWCGGGTRKSDPVGEERPALTAETRAARRCIRFVVANLPADLAMAEAAREADWEVVEEKVGDAMAEDRRLQKEQDSSLGVAGSDTRITAGSAGSAVAEPENYGGSDEELDQEIVAGEKKARR